MLAGWEASTCGQGGVITQASQVRKSRDLTLCIPGTCLTTCLPTWLACWLFSSLSRSLPSFSYPFVSFLDFPFSLLLHCFFLAHLISFFPVTFLLHVDTFHSIIIPFLFFSFLYFPFLLFMTFLPFH